MNKFLAIDFGTTYCRAAYITDGRPPVPVTVPNRYSQSKLPALIQLTSKQEEFRDMGESGPGLPWSFSSIKQKIGFEETVSIGNRKRKVINMATDIFRAIKEDAENHTDEVFLDAVITVPSCFPEKQRAAIKSSAEKSGFHTVRLLDESLAAVLAGGMDLDGKGVLVYALGAGVFTASVYKTDNGVPKPMWHEGDRELGGNTFDELIAGYLIAKIIELSGDHTVLPENISRQKLKNASERLKIELSESSSATADLSSIYQAGAAGNDQKNMEIVLSRYEFEGMINQHLKNTVSHAKKALQKSEIGMEDIGTILIVGGSTKIPLVSKMLKKELGMTINELSESDIAIGAAIYSSQVPDQKKRTRAEDNEDLDNEPEEKDDDNEQGIRTAQKSESTWLEDYSPVLAQLYWQKGEYDRAVDTLESLLNDLPFFISNLCYQRGKILLDDHDIDQAMHYLEKAITYNGRDRHIRNSYHQACRFKGNEFFERGAFLEAKSIVRKGLKYNPKCEGCTDFLEKIEAYIEKRYPGMRNSPGSRKKKKRR